MYWHALCLLVINASKGFNMNVTSTTQTQYTQSTNKSKESQGYVSYTSTSVDKTDTVNNTKESSVVDDFLIDVYSKESQNFKASVIKDEITDKVNEYASLMLQERSDETMTEQERSKLLNQFKSELLEEYKESVENSSDTTLSVQQQAVIRVLMEENTQEASALESLLATKTGTTTTQETKATGKMAEMQEKYKDVYTPTPDTYIEGSEELQMQKVYEEYPKYLELDQIWAKRQSFYEGEPLELGTIETKEQKAHQKIASEKFDAWIVEEYGSQEDFNEMISGGQKIKDKYPYNSLAKDGVHNAKEIARFQNAAVYEGLEQGKTIEEAKIYAGNLIDNFMDTSYAVVNFLETLIKAGKADVNAVDLFLAKDHEEEREKDYNLGFNEPHSSTMNLTEYGIEGNWEYYAKPENQKAMIDEIEKKIGQFNFMLNNESKIKEAYLKLDAAYQDTGNNAGYQKMINEKYMPRMEAGLNIFKNYKIYD